MNTSTTCNQYPAEKEIGYLNDIRLIKYFIVQEKIKLTPGFGGKCPGGNVGSKERK